jgi:hypothetical protein
VIGVRRGGGHSPRALSDLASRARPFVGFAAADGRDALGQRDFETRRWAGVVIEVGNDDAWEPLANRALDSREINLFARRDERKRVAGGLSNRVIGAYLLLTHDNCSAAIRHPYIVIPVWQKGKVKAGARSRTADLLITNRPWSCPPRFAASCGVQKTTLFVRRVSALPSGVALLAVKVAVKFRQFRRTVHAC